MPDDNTPEAQPDSASPWPEIPPSSGQPANSPYQPGQANPPNDGRDTPLRGQPSWPPPPVGSSPQVVGPPNSPVNGTLVLILGILGLTLCGFCAPIAWILGNQAMATLNQYGDPLSQRGMVNGGRICGIVGTILIGIALLFYAIAFAFGLFGALTHPSPR